MALGELDYLMTRRQKILRFKRDELIPFRIVSVVLPIVNPGIPERPIVPITTMSIALLLTKSGISILGELFFKHLSMRECVYSLIKISRLCAYSCSSIFDRLFLEAHSPYAPPVMIAVR